MQAKLRELDKKGQSRDSVKYY